MEALFACSFKTEPSSSYMVLVQTAFKEARSPTSIAATKRIEIVSSPALRMPSAPSPFLVWIPMAGALVEMGSKARWAYGISNIERKITRAKSRK